MDKTFETKDIVTAVYLKANGIYCIGTIPANNKYRPNERLWLFPSNQAVDALLLELRNGDPSVPIKKAFSCASILKNLLNDKDHFDDNKQLD
ncbi:MAG: hypothetical protein ACOH18_05565 [Candidatus Saccharimonadaceae bacterium]